MTKLPAGSPDVLVPCLILVTAEVKEVWDDRRRLEWERGTLSVVSPRGLIALKSMRDSGQDRGDIEHLRNILDED